MSKESGRTARGVDELVESAKGVVAALEENKASN
jgi:hypothetical protein